MINVAGISGYHHFLKFFEREGKSKLSLQKVVSQLQKKFTEEEWYYLRKIHKKEHNYFLNIGGSIGDKGGGGWISSRSGSQSGTNTGGYSTPDEKKVTPHKTAAKFKQRKGGSRSDSLMSGKNSLLDSMDKNNHMQMINEASSDGSSQGKIKETLPFFQVLAGV